jgi:phosphoglycerate kinase
MDTVATGYLMESEIKHLSVLFNATHPFVAVVGGAKISSKINTIYSFLDIADVLLIGGGMTSTFIMAQAEIQGISAQIGTSLIEPAYIPVAQAILECAAKKNKHIVLPRYSLIADSFSESAKYKVALSNQIPLGWMALDIASESYPDYALYLEKAKTIIWNGPMGVFEWSNFAKGTEYIAETIARATQRGTYSVVGGGDSIAALQQFALQDKMSYISTGGGAMLEFIEKKGVLPGILALNPCFKTTKNETI